MVTLVNLLQSPNAYSPIEVTQSGTIILETVLFFTPVILQVSTEELKLKFDISSLLLNFAVTLFSMVNVYSFAVESNSSPLYQPKNSQPKYSVATLSILSLPYFLVVAFVISP